MLAEEKDVKLDNDKISSCDTNKSQSQSNFIKKSVLKSDNSKSDKVEFKFNFNVDSWKLFLAENKFAFFQSWMRLQVIW